MKTKIVCPACEKDYLTYDKGFEWLKWACWGCRSGYNPVTLSRWVRAGEIIIHSVNYPYPLRITSTGTEAAV